MRIMKSTEAEDPFAPLAWSVCLATLALEKISVNESLDREELASLSKAHEILQSIAYARRQESEKLLAKDVTSPLLVSGFSALAQATRHHAFKTNEALERSMQDLENILNELHRSNAASIDIQLVRRAQEGCQTLLENINQLRPTPTNPPYVMT